MVCGLLHLFGPFANEKEYRPGLHALGCGRAGEPCLAANTHLYAGKNQLSVPTSAKLCPAQLLA